MADVVLYQFPGAFGLASLSPFCSKVEAYLRLAGVPFRMAAGDVRKAPMGKLPVVRWDGTLVADSGCIVAHAEAALGAPLDGGLDHEARAVGHLAVRTAEEHLYWVLLTVRWADDETWRGAYRAAIASALPAPLRGFLPGLLRRGVVRALHAHGLGRHAREEVVRRGRQDLAALSARVRDRPFLLGERPTSADCSVHAMVEHLRRTPGGHPLIAAVHEDAALTAYCDRMNERLGW